MKKEEAMRKSGYVFVTAAIAAAAVLTLIEVANAQRPPPATGRPAPATQSAVDACNQFRNALNAPAQAGTQTQTDRAQQSLGKIAEAGQQGITCAQALAKYFENLRKGGAKGTWGDI